MFTFENESFVHRKLVMIKSQRRDVECLRTLAKGSLALKLFNMILRIYCFKFLNNKKYVST